MSSSKRKRVEWSKREMRAVRLCLTCRGCKPVVPYKEEETSANPILRLLLLLLLLDLATVRETGNPLYDSRDTARSAAGRNLRDVGGNFPAPLSYHRRRRRLVSSHLFVPPRFSSSPPLRPLTYFMTCLLGALLSGVARPRDRF